MTNSLRLFSLRRLTLLVAAIALTTLALTPSLTSAAVCTNGSGRTVFTSIVCCSNPPTIPKRPGVRQTCQNGQWVDQFTGCFSSSNCATP